MTSKRTAEEPDYFSYLLRVWRESGDGASERDALDSQGRMGGVWRASLESPQADDRRGFASLEDLFAFLRKLTNADPNPNPENGS